MRPGPRPERRDQHDVAAAATLACSPGVCRNARQIRDGSAEMFRPQRSRSHQVPTLAHWLLGLGIAAWPAIALVGTSS